MSNKVSNQEVINKLFVGRTFEIQKVEWMSTLYPKVNSKEYWSFRKQFGLTHHDYTVKLVVDHFDKKPTRDEIISFLVKTYITKSWKENDLLIQVPQFLGQLTFRGWSGLINNVQKIFEGRS